MNILLNSDADTDNNIKTVQAIDISLQKIDNSNDNAPKKSYMN